MNVMTDRPDVPLNQGDPEVTKAILLLRSRGFDVIIASQYKKLRDWLNETNGWPPQNWESSE